MDVGSNTKAQFWVTAQCLSRKSGSRELLVVKKEMGMCCEEPLLVVV